MTGCNHLSSELKIFLLIPVYMSSCASSSKSTVKLYAFNFKWIISSFNFTFSADKHSFSSTSCWLREMRDEMSAVLPSLLEITISIFELLLHDVFWSPVCNVSWPPVCNVSWSPVCKVSYSLVCNASWPPMYNVTWSPVCNVSRSSVYVSSPSVYSVC